MKSFFSKISSNKCDNHYDYPCINGTFYNIPSICFLKPVNKHQVDQWQRTTHHIGNCCRRCCTQVCSKLLRSHGYKYCPKTCAKTKCRASGIHGYVIVYIATEEINA